MLTTRAYGDLVDELGSHDVAARHLRRVATDTGCPLAANLATGEDMSTTVFISLKGWGGEWLAGWVAAKRGELEAMFGAATVREDV